MVSRRHEKEGPRRRQLRPPCRPRREAGHALITALFVLLLVSLALALTASSLHWGLSTVRNEAGRIRVTTLADAAVAEALAHLASDPNHPGAPRKLYGGGVIESRVIQVSSSHWLVTGTSRYAGRERVVRVEVRRDPDPNRHSFIITGWRRMPPLPGNLDQSR